MAVSTAGDTYQFVEIGGKRYAHLVDPKTGLGITRRVSVTVIAPRGITSDGIDSAAAILGGEKGLKLLDATPGVSGRIVELWPSGLKTTQTAGFAKFLVPSVGIRAKVSQ
jgi:thiamine biosynthesis lipoprotein